MGQQHVVFNEQNVRNAAWSGIAKAFNYSHYDMLNVDQPDEVETFEIINRDSAVRYRVTVEEVV